MSDNVQKNMERMVPEFEEMQTSGLFSAEEVSKIIKKRREQEYSMHRAGKELVDFLGAIEFELNLSYLIKNRGSRLKVPPKLALPSVLGRIHNLFHSATTCFRGDQRLWLQYIDFTMRSRAGQAAGKIFAQALSFHPNFVPFWICAASWEYFSNANIHAARILLQRANRLNPHSQEILLEYCRLELAYREKVMHRLEIFGVGDSELKEASVSLKDVPNGDNKTKGTLEKVADENENKEGQKKRNPFFEGAIPRAVFHAAIAAFPSDLSLRIQFSRIVASFYDTNAILDTIYKSIETDFPENAEAQAFVARRPFDSPPAKNPQLKQDDKNETDLFEITNRCVANFETELTSHASPQLYEQYIAFLLQVLDKVDPEFSKAAQDPSKTQEKMEKGEANPAATTFLRKKIALVFKEAFANSHLSELLCTRWVDFLLATDRLADAVETSEKYATALPRNPLVQTTFFSLLAQLREAHQSWKKSTSTKSKSSDDSESQPEPSPYTAATFSAAKLKKYIGWSAEEMSMAISKALEDLDLEHSVSGDLFVMYWNYLMDSETSVQSIDEDERSAEESIALLAAKNHFKRKLAKLHGAGLQKFKHSTLASALLRWNDKSEESVARVRAIYGSGLDSPPTDFAYYRMCINFETSLSTPRSITLSRRLFEAAVSDFGSKEKNVWLDYIAWETALGQHANASQLFTRAKRSLKNPDEFILEHNRIMDEAFRDASSAGTMDVDNAN